jgi:hypothetical protein
MAVIPVKPRVFKNYKLKIASDNYETSVSAVTLTPATSVQTWRGGTPDAVFTDLSATTWTCDLAYAQDWETAGSLAIYLFNHEGETVACEFSPIGTGPKFTVNAIIVPGQIGGAVDAYGTATVTLGVQGKPVFVPGT